MIRVFAALLPSAAAREHLVHTLRPIHAATTNELRWTDPDNWHVTMAFYGEQPNDAAAVREHLAHAVAGRAALDVHLSGAGSFEQRTLWMGVGGQARGVRELMAECQLADVPFNHYRPPPHRRARWSAHPRAVGAGGLCARVIGVSGTGFSRRPPVLDAIPPR